MTPPETNEMFDVDAGTCIVNTAALTATVRTGRDFAGAARTAAESHIGNLGFIRLDFRRRF